jgi:HEAT repeat protein
MGEVIAALADAMLNKPMDSTQTAARTLAAITDDRVIPYFIQAFESNSYPEKSTILHILGKFNNESAFQTLKQAMETRPEDMTDASTAEGAKLGAERIRESAALALSRSPHPKAIPFLLSKHNDSSESVQFTILIALKKLKTEEAKPILQEMAQANNPRISEAAKGYLRAMALREKG